MAIQPSGEEVDSLKVVTPLPADGMVAENTVPATLLPATASMLPLIALLGLLALGAAFNAPPRAKTPRLSARRRQPWLSCGRAILPAAGFEPALAA